MTDDPPRTIAAQWAVCRCSVLSYYADDDPRLKQAKAIFYAGAYGSYKALCAAPDAIDSVGTELEHWRKVMTGAEDQ